MHQIILIFHLISGSVLEVKESQDVTLFIRNIRLNNNALQGEFSSTIKGNKVHINLSNVEYVEEKSIEVKVNADKMETSE